MKPQSRNRPGYGYVCVVHVVYLSVWYACTTDVVNKYTTVVITLDEKLGALSMPGQNCCINLHIIEGFQPG